MARVTGIGGVFYKIDDPAKTMAWYREHLGVETEEFGATFHWREKTNPRREGLTVWSPMERGTKYFDPSTLPFMINFRVDDLDGVLARLRAAGAWVDDKIDEYDYGRFGWALDPDGVRIELWEPPQPKRPRPRAKRSRRPRSGRRR